MNPPLPSPGLSIDKAVRQRALPKDHPPVVRFLFLFAGLLTLALGLAALAPAASTDAPTTERPAASTSHPRGA